MPSPPSGPVRHLWLLRHAKAASDAPWGGSDRERPLTGRGRRDATALGQRLAAGGTPLPGVEERPTPEQIICSAAVRTRQTADLVVRGLGTPLPREAYKSLYEAQPDLVLQYVREVDGGVHSLLVVGHNPTIYQLVWELLANRDDDGSVGDRAALELHGFPTCALAVLALSVGAWEDVAAGCGRLVGLFKPPY
jgi:phosphohistidine phosphatase